MLVEKQRTITKKIKLFMKRRRTGAGYLTPVGICRPGS